MKGSEDQIVKMHERSAALTISELAHSSRLRQRLEQHSSAMSQTPHVSQPHLPVHSMFLAVSNGLSELVRP
jgi:hypothetical protein